MPKLGGHMRIQGKFAEDLKEAELDILSDHQCWKHKKALSFLIK